MSTARTPKDGAWCWLSKEALRRVREAFDESRDVSYALAVYAALSEIASNNKSETFQVPCSEIEQKSGVSRRKIAGVLGKLQLAGLVAISANFVTPESKERLPNTYTLLQLPSRIPCPTPPAPDAIPSRTAEISSVPSNTRIKEEVIKKEDLFDLPDSLNTARFRQVLSDFETHRREKKKPLTSTARKYLLMKLASLGEDQAYRKVELAVMSNWQGVIFDATEPKGNTPASRQATLRRVDMVNA